MKYILSCICVLLFVSFGKAQTRTIHVFVALCDNQYQGIVPVPPLIGNGKDARNNLYWGAGYGLKTFFDKKTQDWKLVERLESDKPHVLERLLFKHASKDVYLLADAYDGEFIKECVESFLYASNGKNAENIQWEGHTLQFGGCANLLSYIGHDGLMDFELDPDFAQNPVGKRDVMILACYSKSYFSPHIQAAGANPVLWTTHLMAPEAYTLKSAIDGWILQEKGDGIAERAAQTYNQYQKCGLKGARNLFTYGF